MWLWVHGLETDEPNVGDFKKKKVVAVPTQIYYFSEEEINICFPKKYQRKLSL